MQRQPTWTAEHYSAFSKGLFPLAALALLGGGPYTNKQPLPSSPERAGLTGTVRHCQVIGQGDSSGMENVPSHLRGCSVSEDGHFSSRRTLRPYLSFVQDLQKSGDVFFVVVAVRGDAYELPTACIATTADDDVVRGQLSARGIGVRCFECDDA